MPSIQAKMRRELKELIKKGDLLQFSLIAKAPAEARQETIDILDPPTMSKHKSKSSSKGGKTADKALDGVTEAMAIALKEDFGRTFEAWYLRALPVVEQLLPGRYGEFSELYRLGKRPKDLDPSTYTISDFIQGITVTRTFPREEAFSAWHVAHAKLANQINIMRSAEARLDSVLSDVTGVVEADLLDNELSAARELHKTKHLRSAGVVAGVVLERHLKRLVANHQVIFRKAPQIASLNDALKATKVYDVPQWRRIQALGDLRNLCAHDVEREPTSDEVVELIAGVEKVTKTVW
jgi:hypothetical protein